MISSLVTKTALVQFLNIPQQLSVPRTEKMVVAKEIKPGSKSKKFTPWWHYLLYPFAILLGMRCIPDRKSAVKRKQFNWRGPVKRLEGNVMGFRTECFKYDNTLDFASSLERPEPLQNVIRRGQIQTIAEACGIDLNKVKENNFRYEKDHLEIVNNNSSYKFKWPKAIRHFKTRCPSSYRKRYYVFYDMKKLVCSNSDNNSLYLAR